MRAFVIGTIAVSIVGFATAQKTGPLPPLTAQVEVHVVNVDVSVTEANGKPVLDLTKDDFEIFEDGQLQKITNFYAIRNANVNATPNRAAAAAPDVDQFR